MPRALAHEPKHSSKPLSVHLQHAEQPQSGEALASAGFNRPMLRKLEDLGVIERKALENRCSIGTAAIPDSRTTRGHRPHYRFHLFPEVFLLEGVTGSGSKQRCISQSMAPVLAAGKQVLCLFPRLSHATNPRTF